MRRNRSSFPEDYASFDEFKEYFKGFIGSDEFYSNIDDKDLKYLYQQDYVQNNVDRNAEGDASDKIERELTRKHPELADTPRKLQRAVKDAFEKMRKREKRDLRSDVLETLTGKRRKGVSLKRQVKAQAREQQLPVIRQRTRKGGKQYIRAKPKRWKMTKFKENFFRANASIPIRDFERLYRQAYPQDIRTTISLYYKRRRFIKFN